MVSKVLYDSEIFSSKALEFPDEGRDKRKCIYASMGKH